MEVTWFDIEGMPAVELATFNFAYPLSQATVTYVLADSTTRSIITYDFVCPP